MEIQIGVIQHQPLPFRRDAKAVVHVHNVRNGRENLAQLQRNGAAGLGIRAVNLGQKGGHDRWAGRRFHHLHRSAFGQVQRQNTRPQVQSDVMAFAVALTLGREVHLQIAIARLVAQIIVPHQAVEVERRRCARMGLDRDDLFHRLQRCGDLGQHTVGLLDRGPSRHIQNHGKL